MFCSVVEQARSSQSMKEAKEKHETQLSVSSFFFTPYFFILYGSNMADTRHHSNAIGLFITILLRGKIEVA